MGFLASLLPIIFQFLTALPGLIQAAEVAFSGVPGKSGPAKKTLVMNVVGITTGALVSAGQITADHAAAITTLTADAVDSTVKILKDAQALTAKNPVADAGGPTET